MEPYAGLGSSYFIVTLLVCLSDESCLGAGSAFQLMDGGMTASFLKLCLQKCLPPLLGSCLLELVELVAAREAERYLTWLGGPVSH